MQAHRLLAGLSIAVLAIAIATASLTTAQVGTFGSQTRMGDTDYAPVAKSNARQAYFYEAELGDPMDVRDNCVYIRVETNAVAPATGSTRDPVTNRKDIRANDCFGKKAGTHFDDSQANERVGTWTFRPTSIQYADVNGNGKYDRGDYVYAVTDPTVPNVGANDPQNNAAEFPEGLTPTTMAGMWSLRLTPAGSYPAGTFAMPSDTDMMQFRLVAKKEPFVIVEREDRVWYLAPGLALQNADATVLDADADGILEVGDLAARLDRRIVRSDDIPANAIRLAQTGVVQVQPAVQVSSISLPATAPVAGEVYKVGVAYSNEGGAAGAGLLLTKLGSTIVDARLTPVLGIGEKATALIPVPMPEHGGRVVLLVGDYKVNLDVEGPAAADAVGGSAESTADLEARIAALEALLADQQGASPATASVSSVGAPSPAPVVLLGALVGVVLLLRRRAA